MKNILIHCHIFYPNLWKELKQCILNVSGYPFELYVTMVEKNTEIEKDIRINFPKANIEIVENRGYDIGPFIHILNKVDLNKYSYVVKLHTKRDVDPRDAIRKMQGPIWRNNLLVYFKDRLSLKKQIECFNQNPKIGMQAKYQLIVYHDFYDKKAQKALKQFLKEHHLPLIKYAFVAGTMFIVRAHLLKALQKLNLQLSDFPIPTSQQGKHLSQMAHVVERLFGYFVYQQGYILFDGSVSEKFQKRYHTKIYLKYLIKPILRFFWQKKITKSGKTIIKVFRIPLLHFRY